MMIRNKSSQLEFIGGPFDGFREVLDGEVDELPSCVALPLNHRSGRRLGLKFRSEDARREAIYRLERKSDLVRYCFHYLRATQPSVPTR